MKKVIAFIFCLPIYCYRLAIRPWLPHSCKFYPTCSEYTLICIKRFGAIEGWRLGAWRILRCNPFNKRASGYDPVPYRYAGGAKWVI